jgi:histidine ammonia-lyase
VLITRLLTLVNGKSGVRLQLADFLKELLNQDLVPTLPATNDQSVLSAVANACKGEGSTGTAGNAAASAASGQAFAAAAEAAGLSLPGLSTTERAALTSGASAAAGVGSLMIVAGRQLLSAVTAVSALSCEAAGAQVRLSCTEKGVTQKRQWHGDLSGMAMNVQVCFLHMGAHRQHTVRADDKL